MPDDDEPPGGHRWRQRCHQWSRQFLHQASSVGSEESRWFLHLPTGWWRNSGSTVVYHGTSQCSSNHECTAKCQFKVWDACGRGCNLVMLQYQCFPFSSCCLNKLLDFLSNALFCCALFCVSLRSFRLWLNLNLKALILTPWKSSKICANQMNLRFQTSKEGCSRPYQKKGTRTPMRWPHSTEWRSLDQKRLWHWLNFLRSHLHPLQSGEHPWERCS